MAAATELNAHKADNTPWARAHAVQSFFTGLIAGEQTSAHWQADNDLDQLMAGDVLSWCEGQWCSGDGPNAGDTGHLSIVLASEPVEAGSIKARLRGVPTDASFYKVAVVNASHHVHGSHYADEQTFGDRRHQSGPLKSTACDSNGGIGAASVLFAQWFDEQSQRRWSYALFNDYNHHFHAPQLHGPLTVSFARLQNPNR